ncbi:MAG: hypothetical protein VB875_06555 [Pirellulales bacterium]
MLTVHLLRRDRRRIVVFAAVLWAFVLSPISMLQGEEAELNPTLDELESRLAGSNPEAGWNQLLKTETLHEQLAAAADWLVMLSLPAADELSAAVEAAKNKFAASSKKDVAQSQRKAIAALAELERFLNRHRKRAEGWKAYLKWAELTRELDGEKPNLDTLKFVVDQLSIDHDGLEKQQFLAVRRAIRRLIDQSLVLLNTDGARKTYEKYVADIAELLKSYGPESSHYDAIEIGRRLGFMQRLGQADQLIAAVRSRYAHPNLIAHINSDVATAGMKNEIDEPTTHRGTILGTYIVAKGHTTGSVQATLVPDPQRAVFELTMNGETKAKSVGYARSVRVFSDSTTQLNATKRIYFTRDGLSSDPADASAQSSSKFTGVSAQRQFVERLAWKQAKKKKGSAEAEASHKASKKLQVRVDEQAAKQLSEANDNYLAKFRHPLQRLEAFPELFDVHTDGDAVRIKMLQATAEQLASPTPPEAPVEDTDMAVRLHESVVNNFAAVMLGGVTMVSEGAPEEVIAALKRRGDKVKIAKKGAGIEQFQLDRLEKVKQRRKAEGKSAPKARPDDDDWFAITFAQRDPLSVEFRDGKVKFTIRGIRFLGPQQSDAKVTSRQSIFAEYSIKKDQYGGLRLVLEDAEKDWGVIQTGVERGGRLRPGDQGVTSKLRARFRTLFVGEENENTIVEIFPFKLPGNWAKLGEFKYSVAESKGGWLSIAMDRKSKEKQAAKPTRPVAAIQRLEQAVPEFIRPKEVDAGTPVARAGE